MSGPRVQQIIDGTLGATAISTPVWFSYIEQGLGLFVLVGGAALLIMRLVLSWREIRSKKKSE